MLWYNEYIFCVHIQNDTHRFVCKYKCPVWSPIHCTAYTLIRVQFGTTGNGRATSKAIWIVVCYSCLASFMYSVLSLGFVQRSSLFGRHHRRHRVLGDQLQQAAVDRSRLAVRPADELTAQDQTKKSLVAASSPPSRHTHSATNSSGVHEPKSPFGIHLRFIGVSSVTGRMDTTSAPSGRPELLPASDLVSWCTAALAMP